MSSAEKHLLLVDDEPELLELLQFEFERADVVVHTALSGPEALEVLESSPISLVLSDVRMAGGDGVELLKRIRAQVERPLPVFLITGFADITAEEAFSLGVDEIFPKPFDRGRLKQQVSWMLDQGTDLSKGPSWLADASCPSEIAVAAEEVCYGRSGFSCRIGAGILGDPRTQDPIRFRVGNRAAAPLEGRGLIRWTRPAEQGGRILGVQVLSLEERSIEPWRRIQQGLGTVARIPSFRLPS